MSFKDTVKAVGSTICKHSPVILAVTGVACGCAAVYFAIKNTPAAAKELDQAIENTPEEVDPALITDDPDMGKIERTVKHYIYKIDMSKNGLRKSQMIKLLFPYYWKAGLFVVGALTAGTLSHIISWQRCVNAVSIAKLAEDRLEIFKDETVKAVGEQKATEIQKNADATEMNRKYESFTDISAIPLFGEGAHDTLFMEYATGQIFLSNWLAVNLQIKSLEEKIKGYGEMDLYDYLDAFNLRHCGYTDAFMFMCDDPTTNEEFISVSDTTEVPSLRRPAYVLRPKLKLKSNVYGI